MYDSDNKQSGSSFMLREQDRFLPICNIIKIMKVPVPENGKIAKDARECIQECVSEFISFITSEAIERSIAENRKTVNGDDLLYAFANLGFDNYVTPLSEYLHKFRESTKSDRNLYHNETILQDDSSSEIPTNGSNNNNNNNNTNNDSSQTVSGVVYTTLPTVTSNAAAITDSHVTSMQACATSSTSYNPQHMHSSGTTIQVTQTQSITITPTTTMTVAGPTTNSVDNAAMTLRRSARLSTRPQMSHLTTLNNDVATAVNAELLTPETHMVFFDADNIPTHIIPTHQQQTQQQQQQQQQLLSNTSNNFMHI
ncbi:transcriptional activator HAP3-like [Teleopsis dalmanni]|uniref:transcriptional activator HAP3-like n=1 Tax=Teleopsis dalmanni TaxID=139649 RepID=UPI0018CFA5EE|nr:transcriptional activator HAP3-like [Teleopsis dalmanni]